MNLKKKKKLIARTFGIGVGRVKLSDMKEEIKEAITRQDIKDLKKEKIISIKEKKGRKRKMRKKIKRGQGSRKKKVSTRKQDYVKLTRKLRKYIKNLKIKGRINKEKYRELRKQIRMRKLRDLKHLIGAVKEKK